MKMISRKRVSVCVERCCSVDDGGVAYCDLARDIVLAEDVALDDAGLLCLCEVADARGEDGVAVIGFAVFGEEADEALGGMLAIACLWWLWMGRGTHGERWHSCIEVRVGWRGLRCGMEARSG